MWLRGKSSIGFNKLSFSFQTSEFLKARKKKFEQTKSTKSKKNNNKVQNKAGGGGVCLALWLSLNCLCQTDFCCKRQRALSVLAVNKQRF